MKKLTLFLFALFCGVLITQAQGQTISLPNHHATITPDQIKALGQQSSERGSRSVIVLDFEGLGDNDAINNFYNGGTSGQGYSGVNYGIEFGDALGLIDADNGGSGNFANEPSPSTTMYFLNVSQAYMNVPAGFTTGFSFYYSSFSTGSVSVYDGLNGTGNLLGSIDLGVNFNNNCSGDPTGVYCHWDPISVAFSGTAKSVVFGGNANYIIFDDVTIGSVTPGGSGSSQIPVSPWALVFGVFLIAVFMVVRYKRNLA